MQIVLFYLLLVALVTGASASLRPHYTATSLVMLEPSKVWADAESALRAPDSASVDGAVEIMRSEPVLDHALTLLGEVGARDWGGVVELKQGLLSFFRLGEGAAGATDPFEASLRAREALSIHRRGLTPVIAVTARAGTPELAARLANSLAEAHVALHLKGKLEAVAQARERVAAQLAKLSEMQGLHHGGGAGSAGGNYARLAGLSAQLAGMEALQLSDFRIVAPAEAPRNASFPDIRAVLAVTLVLGLPLVVGGVVAWEAVATGVRSSSELALALGENAGPAILVRDGGQDGALRLAETIVHRPHSLFAESMRLLEGQVLRCAPPNGLARVVAVCSPDAHEHKTEAALGLARTLDANGYRVLLIDANRETGVVARSADQPPSNGLSSDGSDIAQLALLLQRDSISTVSLLLGGNGEDLYRLKEENHILPGILRAAGPSFDFVIVDTAVGQYAAELGSLFGHVDAVVMVGVWGQTSARALREAVQLIGQLRAWPVTVLPVLFGRPAADID